MIQILFLLFVSISGSKSKDLGEINTSESTAQPTWWQSSWEFCTKYWWVFALIVLILSILLLYKRYKRMNEENQSLPTSANEKTRLSSGTSSASNKELVNKKFGVKYDAIETVNIGIKEFSFSKPETGKSDTFKSPLNPNIYRPTPLTEASKLMQ